MLDFLLFGEVILECVRVVLEVEVFDPVLHTRKMDWREALMAAPNAGFLVNWVSTDDAFDLSIAEPFCEEDALLR